METLESKGNRSKKLNPYGKISFPLFFLLTYHVLIIFYIQNVFGFHINSLSFIMIKMWKEVVVVLLLTFFLFSNLLKGRFQPNISFATILIYIYIIIGLIYVIIAPNNLTAIWSFRNIFEIFLFFFLGMIVSFLLVDFVNFFKLMFIAAVITSIFAIIQVEILGADFFHEVYGLDDVAVAQTAYGYGKLRASSTFITPHEFGLFLVIQLFSIPLLFNKTDNKHRIWLFLGVFIVLTGLIYSLSRSSIVILLIGMIFLSVRNLKFIFLLGLILLLGYFFLEYFGVLENLQAVFSGDDPSSSGRISVLKEAYQYFKEYPMGSGMGTVGVVVRRFNPDAPQFEGEFWNIIAMMGPFSALLHLMILSYFFFFAYKISINPTTSTGNKLLSIYIILIVIALFTRDLILPRDFTNYSLGWFIFGAYYQYINSIVTKTE